MSGRPPAPLPGQPPALPARRPPPPPPAAEPEPVEEYYSEFHGEGDIQDDSPPPPPPPPPSRRPEPPSPVTEEYYSEFHGEADAQEDSPSPPPPPPTSRPPAVPSASEEIYDDFEEGNDQPLPQEDVYEVTEDVSLPQVPPPLPGNRPKPALPSTSAPPPPSRDAEEEVYADPDQEPEVYEPVDDNPPKAPLAPAPPPVPPNRTRRELPTKPDPPAARPEPKPAPSAGGGLFDVSAIRSKLGNLRKTNVSLPEGKPDPGPTPKLYTDNSSFEDRKKLFEKKAPPGVEDLSPKGPVINQLPKPPHPSRPIITSKPPPKPASPSSSSSDSGGSLKSPVQPTSPASPADDVSDEIYDDAGSFLILDPLVGNSWYYPDKDRKSSTEILNRRLTEDGTFLVRKSTKDPDKPYTIDVVYKLRLYHLQVRLRKDKKYALGTQKEDEMTFKDVKELVEHHKKKEVILIGDHPGSVLLKRSP